MTPELIGGPRCGDLVTAKNPGLEIVTLMRDPPFNMMPTMHPPAAVPRVCVAVYRRHTDGDFHFHGYEHR